MRTETAGDGSQRIVVEVPGVDDPDQVRRLVGSTGQLEFIDPQGQQLTEDQDITSLIEDGTVGVLFDGGEIDIASVAPAVDGNIIGVQFTLSDSASDICEFTSANVGRPDRSRSTAQGHHGPNIQGAICGGQTIITVGPQTPENEAERRSSTTRSASARCRSPSPSRASRPSTRRSGPTSSPGADRRRRGPGPRPHLHDRYYRLPASWRRSRSSSTRSYAVFRVIGVTLTLAGVAAFILSIGMAVDANILIFERMKEEIRAGKTLGPAIEAGFNRAWSSILDSNVATCSSPAGSTGRGRRSSRIRARPDRRCARQHVQRRHRHPHDAAARDSHGWGRNIELYHVER